MSQFIESICVENGCVLNLASHQLRVDQSLAHLGFKTHTIQLAKWLHSINLPIKGIFKLRIVYNTAFNLSYEIKPYQYKTINSFKLMEIGQVDYAFKYENRDWIHTLLKEAETDDIIMHQDGMIKDSSYASTVFLKMNNWYTPAFPLLPGTMRSNLIHEGLIQPLSIHINDLSMFSHFKLINAMMSWEKAQTYPISALNI